MNEKTEIFSVYSSLKAAFFLFAIHLALPFAMANDGAARIGIGGIEFVKNSHIRMKSEILEISKKRVRVEYHFINESDQDINTTVAFPTPRYHRDTVMGPGGPVKFVTTVDGQFVSTKKQHKAFIKDRDITPRLRELGLSEKQMFADANNIGDECFRKGPRFVETRKDKIKPKWFEEDMPPALLSEGFVSCTSSSCCPSWSVEETYFWDQRFPSGKEVVVVHEYQPHAGIRYDGGVSGRLLTASDIDEACLKDGTGEAIQKRVRLLKQKTNRIWVDMSDVEYILKTARTWKGPIGEFVLRVRTDPREIERFKKPATLDQYVSLCFPGKPKKLDANTFEFRHRDFVPPDSIIVYFYNVVPSD